MVFHAVLADSDRELEIARLQFSYRAAHVITVCVEIRTDCRTNVEHWEIVRVIHFPFAFALHVLRNQQMKLIIKSMVTKIPRHHVIPFREVQKRRCDTLVNTIEFETINEIPLNMSAMKLSPAIEQGEFLAEYARVLLNENRVVDLIRPYLSVDHVPERVADTARCALWRRAVLHTRQERNCGVTP